VFSPTVDEWVTAPEAARAKGVAESSVRRAIQTGRLPGLRKGRVYLVRRGDLDAWRPIGHRPRGNSSGPHAKREAPLMSLELEPSNDTAIQLLRAWRAGDKREQGETWSYLRRVLDEDRLSDRKLFP
jgi:excisionase family DNA binding protein